MKQQKHSCKIIRYLIILLLISQMLSYAYALEDEEQTALIGDDTGTIYNSGEIITENCTLYSNLNVDTRYGIIIGKDNITIDGNGYTLTFIGNASDSEAIHVDGFHHVTIKNFTLINFCFGIYMHHADHGNIFNNTIIYTVGSGIWLHNTSHTLVLGNTVGYGDEGHGLFISTQSHDNVLTNNTLTTANARGLCIEHSHNITLLYNMMCGNRRGDFLIENSTGIKGDFNTATQVSADGYNDQTDGTPCTYACQKASEDPDLSSMEGLIITEDFTFTENMTISSGHGIIIGADNITIDGSGFILDGASPGSCDGSGVQRSGIFNPGFDNIVIKNLEIEHFGNGIYLRGDKMTGDYIYNNTIDSCEIHHNGNAEGSDTATHGIKMEYVFASRITNCSVHHNTGKGGSCEAGGNGIFLYGSKNNFVSNNFIFDNTKGGIFTKMKSSFNKISYNTVMNNGQGGIILRCKLSRLSVIEHNNIEDNKGPGIYVGGSSNTIMYNVINSSQDGSQYDNDASIPNGIRISREADYTNLVSNTVSNNDAEDIWVKTDLKHTSGYNNTYNSSKNYDESWGMKLIKVESSVPQPALPTFAPTPLMATIMVFLSVFIVIGGYLKNSHNGNEYSKISNWKKRLKK